MSEIDYNGLWKQYAKYTKAYIFDRFKESNQSYILERQAHIQTKKELEELQDAIINIFGFDKINDPSRSDLATFLRLKRKTLKNIEASHKRNKLQG